MMNEETSMPVCASDPVYAPAHYAGDGKVECKAAMASMMAGYDRAVVCSNVVYWCGCAFKYLRRWPLKNNREDLKRRANASTSRFRSSESDWLGQGDTFQ